MTVGRGDAIFSALEFGNRAEVGTLSDPIEMVQAAVAAINERDWGAWERLLEPRAFTVPVCSWPESAPVYGPGAAWNFYRQVDDVFHIDRYELEGAEQVGDQVVARIRTGIVGRTSGAGASFVFGLLATVAGGRIVRAEWFEQIDEAKAVAREREAAGDRSPARAG